jgi:hypothetical protein
MAAQIPAGFLDRAISTKTGVKWWIQIQQYREKNDAAGNQTTFLAAVEGKDAERWLKDMIGFT